MDHLKKWRHRWTITGQNIVRHTVRESLKLRLDDDVCDVGGDGVVPLRTDHGDVVPPPGQLLTNLHHADLVTPARVISFQHLLLTVTHLEPKGIHTR